jgi:histidinol-phosphatase
LFLGVPSVPELSRAQLEKYLSVARRAAQQGGQRALKYFQKKITVTRKVDRSPVTRADREAEQVIRRILGKAFPSHMLCGEEYGWEKAQKAEFKWWIDPVDGTRQFVRGIPFWGTLVALEHMGEVIVGVIRHPALGLTLWAAKGMGCFADGKKAQVSKIPKLQNGTFTYGGMRLVPPGWRKRMEKLCGLSDDDRGFGDCFGHGFVIMGKVEAMLDPVVKPYDVAAIKICVEEAGGKFTDLKGRPTIYGGNAVSSNGLVHSQILKALKNAAD